MSIYTQASGDSHSQQNGRGLRRWHTRRLIQKRPSFLKPFGLQFPMSGTSNTCDGTGFAGRMERLTSLRAECLASLQACLAIGWGVQTSGGCGLKPSQSFASYDPERACLKTRQLSLALSLDGPSQESSVDWPRSGMMCCGEAFSLPRWMQDTSGNASPSLLPTPTTRDWKDTPGMDFSKDARNGRERVDQLPRRIFVEESLLQKKERLSGGMKLTPEFQCWLMGFPRDWLKPLRDAPATRSCRKRSTPSSPPSMA